MSHPSPTQEKNQDKTEIKSEFDVDVIVVGAGPIGLTTACALRHHGVDCRIFEERSKPKPYSRANNVWARGQELLDGIGLREPLAKQSYLIEKQTLFLDGKPLDAVHLDEVDSPFPKVFYSGQDVIEKTLSDIVSERGHAVERGRKVVEIAPDEDGVYVTIEDVSEGDGPKQPPERLRCRFLVGADGAEGGVRKTVGLEYETVKFPNRATRQIDAKLSWKRSTEANQLWFFSYHNGFAGVLPVWGGYHRLFFLEDDENIPDRDPTLEEMQGARARNHRRRDADIFRSDLVFDRALQARRFAALSEGPRLFGGRRRAPHLAHRRSGHERRFSRCGRRGLASGDGAPRARAAGRA